MSAKRLTPLEELRERLRWVLTNRDLTVDSWSTAAGLSHGVVSHLMNGRTKRPQVETMMALAKAADVSFAWLATGEGHPVEHKRRSTPHKR